MNIVQIKYLRNDYLINYPNKIICHFTLYFVSVSSNSSFLFYYNESILSRDCLQMIWFQNKPYFQIEIIN